MSAGAGRVRGITAPPAPWAAVTVIVAAIAVAAPTVRAPLLTVACIGLAAVRLDLAVLLWMAAVGLAPAPLWTVRNSAVCLSTVVLSVLCVRQFAMRVHSHDVRLPRSALTVPLLALAGSAVASGVLGALWYDESVAGVHRYMLAELYATGLIVLSVATVFLVDAQITSRARLVQAAGVLVAVGVIIIGVFTVKPGLILMPRWYPIMLTHAFVLLYAAMLCRVRLRPWQWLAGVIVLGLIAMDPVRSFVGRAESQWISGWLMIGVPLLLLPLLRFPRTGLVVSVVVALVAARWMWPLVDHVFEVAQREGDFGRVTIWRDALRMGSLRPFLGVGLGNYIDYAERYSEVDFALASAHGNYQQVIAEMGVTGLGFLLWLLVRAFNVGWRLFRTAADPFYRSIGLAACGGLAGQAAASVLGDYLLPAYHNGGHQNVNATLYSWMMLGILMATERLARSSPTPTISDQR